MVSFCALKFAMKMTKLFHNLPMLGDYVMTTNTLPSFRRMSTAFDLSMGEQYNIQIKTSRRIDTRPLGRYLKVVNGPFAL